MIRTYQELSEIEDFEERFQYLRLDGSVGEATFGFDRHINQKFYRSRQWKLVRHEVIARDLGCDLGIEDRAIYGGRIIIHHMNPMIPDDIVHGEDYILNPDFLITTTHGTHNAIHYGDENLLSKPIVARSSNDTKLW